MSFNFKAENGTDTSITEVTTDISKDNGYGATSSLYQKYGSGGFMVKDGTHKQEGVTSTNGNYLTGTSDTLVNSKALAKYEFITTTPGTSWRIPDWCNYIKVFLIGGGGGGAEKHPLPFGYYSAGTGGGCGQLAVAGIKVTGGSTYNVIIGAGGTANPTSSGFGNKGGDGGDTVFYYPAGAPFVSITAKGGKGGWGAQTWLNNANGWGGGQDGGGNTNRNLDHSYDITDVNYWASFYSGKPSTIVYINSPVPGGTGTEINPGGKGFAQGVESEYGFYPDPVANPINTPGLVREMAQHYASASGYGRGGDGAAGFQCEPHHPSPGAAGCACVFYFPFEI